MEVIERLNNISKTLLVDNNVQAINNGGCGLFAALIAENFDLKDCLYAQHFENPNPNKFGFENSSTQHVFIKLNDKFYDCKGFHNPKFISGFKTKITYELLISELENIRMWNSYFSCFNVIPNIINTINANKYETV